jgi:rubredoxin
MTEMFQEFMKITSLIIIVVCFLIFALVMFVNVVLSPEREQEEEEEPKTLKQNIKCPACGAVNYDVEVAYGPVLGFDTYVHECIVCGYVITESHWEEVK